MRSRTAAFIEPGARRRRGGAAQARGGSGGGARRVWGGEGLEAPPGVVRGWRQREGVEAPPGVAWGWRRPKHKKGRRES